MPKRPSDPESNIKSKLGRRIAQLRERIKQPNGRKLSQESLSEMTGYSPEFIGMVERGINAPSVEGCERIAIALKVDLYELFVFESLDK